MSKRSLRPDPNFDLLISKIYPSRDEYEAHQERVLAKLNNSHSHTALANSITEGMKLQNQNRPQRTRKNAGEPENPGNTISVGSNTTNTSDRDTPVVPPSQANQSDSSQGATGGTVNNSNGIENSMSNMNQQNFTNDLSQPASNPAVSGTRSTCRHGIT